MGQSMIVARRTTSMLITGIVGSTEYISVIVSTEYVIEQHEHWNWYYIILLTTEKLVNMFLCINIWLGTFTHFMLLES